LWKKLILPKHLTITLHPRFNNREQKLILRYNLSGINWILRIILNISRRYMQLEITDDQIIIPIPTTDLPYKIQDISGNEITINLKRRNT